MRLVVCRGCGRPLDLDAVGVGSGRYAWGDDWFHGGCWVSSGAAEQRSRAVLERREDARFAAPAMFHVEHRAVG